MLEDGGWVSPQFATAAGGPFDGAGWVFERKLDGVRVIAVGSGGRVRLWSRNHNDVTASYPEIAAALEMQFGGRSFVFDGEVVALDESGGIGGFGLLQKRIHLTDVQRIARTGVAVAYVVFDLLHFDGHDARPLRLVDRKSLLADLGGWEAPLVLLPHVVERGRALYAEALEEGWEGVVAKRADGRYRSGRGRDWLKVKAVRGQEFVVGGFTPPAGSRARFGALLVGYYDEDGRLVFAGRVGSGFSDDDLDQLYPALEQLEVSGCPFVDVPRLPGARWVEPRLVVQIRFGEWTSAGRLRHPVYQGVRVDKDPVEVRREG